MRGGFVMFLTLLFARGSPFVLDVTDVTRFLRPEVVSFSPHRHLCDEIKEGRAMTTKEINQRRDARVAHDLVSAASFDRDLMKRIVAIRNLVCGRIVFTTSFGVEDQAIAHAIFDQALEIDVVTLDTGRLFPQTYELWAQTERRYGRRMSAFYPDRARLESLVARQGINGFFASPEARRACCGVRAGESLRHALAGAAAWITVLRADQSDEGACISFADFDPNHRLVKVNPLFDWTRERVLSFIREHDIPYNSLH